MDKSPGAPDAFPNLEMKAEFFKPVSQPGFSLPGGKGGTTMGFEQTGIPQYFLGGVTGVVCLWLE